MSELVASILFLVFGFAFLFESYNIKVLRFGSLGGDFFPKLLSIMMIAFSGIWFTATTMQFLRKRKAIHLEFMQGGIVRIVVYLIGSVVYVIMLDLFGFFVPSVGVSLLLYLLLKEKIKPLDFLTGITFSILIVTIVWLLFTRVLGLILPTGRLI